MLTFCLLNKRRNELKSGSSGLSSCSCGSTSYQHLETHWTVITRLNRAVSPSSCRILHGMSFKGGSLTVWGGSQRSRTDGGGCREGVSRSQAVYAFMQGGGGAGGRGRGRVCVRSEGSDWLTAAVRRKMLSAPQPSFHFPNIESPELLNQLRSQKQQRNKERKKKQNPELSLM